MNATITPSIPSSTHRAEPPADVPYHLSVDEFYRMIDAGILPPEKRVYLWSGRIYEAMAKTVQHALSFSKVVTAFSRLLPPDWILWPENPITIAADKAPLPDLALVRGKHEDYANPSRHPGASDVGLVVEIAMSSHRSDTTTKLEQYARSLLPAYWVVNLVTRRVLACAGPRVEDGIGLYGSVTTYGPDESVPLVLDGREVARVPVRDLLDPEPQAPPA